MLPAAASAVIVRPLFLTKEGLGVDGSGESTEKALPEEEWSEEPDFEGRGIDELEERWGRGIRLAE